MHIRLISVDITFWNLYEFLDDEYLNARVDFLGGVNALEFR